MPAGDLYGLFVFHLPEPVADIALSAHSVS